jgi:hypothetical protein
LGLHITALNKMRGDNFQNLIKNWSVNLKHFLKHSGIKTIHLFFGIASIATMISRLDPGRTFWFTTT